MKISHNIFSIPYEYWYRPLSGDPYHITELRTMSDKEFCGFGDLDPVFCGKIIDNKYDPSGFDSNDKHFYVFNFEDPSVERDVFLFTSGVHPNLAHSNIFIREVFEGTVDECLIQKLTW